MAKRSIPLRDRELGMDRPITRRDFLSGVAVGIGALGLAGNLEAATAFPQTGLGKAPQALTGMRGSHDGFYDYSHALRDGKFWKSAGRAVNTKEVYDLVIVGGGISGLAAAYFYRAQTNPAAKILILDNHDDFGGHAKRNEFRPGGRLLITNGGTAGIESPFDYSKEAGGLLTELGIDPPALAEKSQKLADRSAFQGLQGAYFFDKETFGADRLVVGAPGGRGGQGSAGSSWKEFLAKTPLSEQAQAEKEALKYGVKVPLCYIAVGLRNWQAFQKMGIRGASAPGMYTSGINLEAPTRIGDYLPEIKSPDDPVLARTGRDPNKPGLSARAQQRAGHAELLATPFSTFERNIRDQMARILGPGAFDPARDIEAITVNRWPHGYAYEYNYLWDPEWKKGESPCELGRKQFGRISSANSDAAAAAYTDQAIDQAYRAVEEQLASKA